MRVSEVIGIEGCDIDSVPAVLYVANGKGGKDRLAFAATSFLRTYRRLARPRVWLFPGHAEEQPIEPTVLHVAFRSADKAAGLQDGLGTSPAAVEILWHL